MLQLILENYLELVQHRKKKWIELLNNLEHSCRSLENLDHRLL
nr:MAG TPA: coiled coil protein [Caudoviricetes sp.]